MVLALGALTALAGSAAGASAPHVFLVVSDDLGYHDLGYKNGNVTQTPHINELVASGIQLESHYAYKLCSPTRASILSGRYPWGVGFYDMDDSRFGDTFHCIDPRFDLLPARMATLGYSRHAIGKWDVGFAKKHCSPTFRGFETFLGYYTACTSDYWYHGAPGGNITYSKCGGIDFHDSNGTVIKGAAMKGVGSYNGTYDQEIFTQRALSLIVRHQPDDPSLFVYLAYHNVHDTCGADKQYPGRLNAPADTVARYATTKLDTWKVQAAMTTELDYGIGNVTATLRAKGMWENTVLILQSDNGGPLDHSNNYPLRGGKASLWEGGLRIEAIVCSPLIPPSRWGTKWSGISHTADWYRTIVEGIAGGSADNSGPRTPDSVNLWPAITGANLTSPRIEVIHRVENRYFNHTLGDSAGQALRVGEWKLLVDYNCNSSQVWQAWPELAAEAVPFGLSGGEREPGTDHLRASSLPKGWQSVGRADPKCASGIGPVDYHNHGETVCCAKSCGVCGVASECQLPVKNGTACPCASRPGGADACCVSTIEHSGRLCSESGPPCIVHKGGAAPCLFNVVTDPGEHHNVASDPANANLIAQLLARLAAAAATGPPLASAFPPDIGPINQTAQDAICEQQEQTGYLEPLDWRAA